MRTFLEFNQCQCGSWAAGVMRGIAVRFESSQQFNFIQHAAPASDCVAARLTAKNCNSLRYDNKHIHSTTAAALGISALADVCSALEHCAQQLVRRRRQRRRRRVCRRSARPHLAPTSVTCCQGMQRRCCSCILWRARVQFCRRCMCSERAAAHTRGCGTCHSQRRQLSIQPAHGRLQKHRAATAQIGAPGLHVAADASTSGVAWRLHD
jgi:hypothetical protein